VGPRADLEVLEKRKISSKIKEGSITKYLFIPRRFKVCYVT
jgi:hypothetical protein